MIGIRELAETIVRAETNGLCPLDGPCEMCDCFDPQHGLARRLAADLWPLIDGWLAKERERVLREAADRGGIDPCNGDCARCATWETRLRRMASETRQLRMASEVSTPPPHPLPDSGRAGEV